MNKIKIVGYFFITSIYLFLSLILVVFFLEFFNIKDKILLKKTDPALLHQTDYYGEKKKVNPYAKINKKELHPYYLFFVPSKEIDNNEIDKTVINFNKDYFRYNPSLKKDFQKKGIFLGGSTAFGYYASNDSKTPAALLTEKTNVNFSNLNSPSWNSHQELLAIAKYSLDYDYSVSLTGSNDITIYCRYNKNTDLYPDTPESYKYLKKIVNDWSYFHLSQIDFIELVEIYITKKVPNTVFMLSYLKNYKEIKKKENKRILEYNDKDDDCNKGDAKIIAESFIKNQKKIRDISEAKNSKHIIILQPFLNLESNDQDYYFIAKEVYDLILKTDFCKKDCYNFMDLFEEYKLNKKFNSINNNYDKVAFVDTVHLTDIGNEILAKKISSIINKK